MNYKNIQKIEELYNYNDVNNYLAIGWTLLNQYTTVQDYIGPGASYQIVHYILGWEGSGDAVYPESEYVSTATKL